MIRRIALLGPDDKPFIVIVCTPHIIVQEPKQTGEANT